MADETKRLEQPPKEMQKAEPTREERLRENPIGAVFGYALGDYCDTMDKEEPTSFLTLQLTFDMVEEFEKLRPNVEACAMTDGHPNTSRGITIVPNKDDEKFHILINENFFWESADRDDCLWMETFSHELTHVYDIREYAKLKGIDDCSKVTMIPTHLPFLMWSECHASKVGFYMWRKMLGGADFCKEEGLADHIMNKEFPLLISKLIDSLNKDVNGLYQLYDAMQFFGKILCYTKMCPDELTKESWTELFKLKDWMLEMYTFLEAHQELDEAWEHFEEFRSTLGIIDKCQYLEEYL